MFERFTDRARRVVVLAQEEARGLGHNYIGTEHLLLGLIDEGEGVAARALEAVGVTLGPARAQVLLIIGERKPRSREEPSGHIPFTPRAKKVLELSLREALQLGHNYIGTEHILLGLIREGEGVAAQVLVKLGANPSRTRQQVIQLLSGYADPTGPGLPTVATGPQSVPLSPGVLAVAGGAPALRQVIALGRPVPLPGGARLIPISVTVWSSFVELRYAADGAQAPPPAMTPEDWAVEDDLGTRYAYVGAALSAAGALLLGTICFTPPPPAGARRLSLLGPAGARVDVDLPASAPAEGPAGGEDEPEPGPPGRETG